MLFEVSPMWLLPPHTRTTGGVGWAWWEQVMGDTYVIFGVVVLAPAARFTPRLGAQPGACALSRNVTACPHDGLMPGIPHEAVVEVLRNEPQLLAMLLGRLGVRLPSGSVPVIADSNLSSRDPDFMKTLLADNVFVFQGLRKKVAVVAEVQTARPKRSRSLAWPAYLANARAILRCDTVLCVFGLSADAVLGSLRTIMTGHPGFALSPLVTGHRMLPGPGGMAFGPELTVLNVLTGDLDLTTHEGRMLALVSIAPAPIERRERYTRYIRAVIPPAARDALEELLKTVIKDEFLDGILAQGEAKGEARMLLRYLGIRFEVSAVVRERITSCGDPAQLEAWLDRAVSAVTLDEVFAG